MRRPRLSMLLLKNGTFAPTTFHGNLDWHDASFWSVGHDTEDNLDRCGAAVKDGEV